MENARPNQCIEFELGCVARDAMDKEVVVQVLTDGKQVVVQLFNLFVLSEDFNIVHFSVDHRVEAINQFIFQHICKFVV